MLTLTLANSFNFVTENLEKGKGDKNKSYIISFKAPRWRIFNPLSFIVIGSKGFSLFFFSHYHIKTIKIILKKY
jgi:hypothetical protein